MILGIDHIAASVSDISKAGNYLKGHGFEEIFAYINIKNVQIKKALMRDYKSSHGIALYKKSGSISIELLDYNPRTGSLSSTHNIKEVQASDQDHLPVDRLDRVSYILPLLPEQFREGSIDQHSGNDRVSNASFNLQTINVPELEAFGLSETAGDQNDQSDQSATVFGIIEKVFIKVADIKKSLDLWQRLGFQVIDKKPGRAELEFYSMLDRRSFKFVLIEMPGISEKHYMDDTGFNSIALLVTGARQLCKELADAGFNVTSVESLNLGTRELDIFFIYGPCDEIFEIIEIAGDHRT